MNYSSRTSRSHSSSTKSTRHREVWKGAAAGAVGGLVASWVMDELSPVIQKIASSAGNGQQQKQTANSEQPEDATMITAEKISELVAGIRLTKEQKKKGGAIVHYAFGALMGAVYGAAAEILPPVTSLAGLPYGAALFVGVDEVSLSALGLTKMPDEYPLSSHLSGLGQHLVYGVTTEFVRRTLRNRS
jgi:putative membrane protein